MTISPDVEAFFATDSNVKQSGQWRRKGVDGPPYVTDPSGDKVKSGERKGLPKLLLYGRPSGRGKIIENTYNLQKWGERMAMWGATLAPDIVLDAGNITHEIDTPEWRQAMDKIAARAKDAAQAMLAAHRGIHIHVLTEEDDEDHRWVNRLLAGEELGISSAAQKALVQAWRRMLAVHGFEILAVEAAVVCDRWRLAGTLDRIVRLARDLQFVTTSGEIVTLPAGTVLILDLKTGKMTLDREAIRYWHSYAIQVAAYALGVPYDVDAETRGSWPFEVSQDWAIIAHLDVLTAIEEGEARCTLVLCDLQAGITAGDLCMEAVAWGRNDSVFSPPNPEMVVAVPVPIAAPQPATDDDFDRANGEPCRPASSPESSSSTEERSTPTTSIPPSSGSPGPSTTTSTRDRRQSILARLTALPDAQKARIKAAWPASVPSLKSSHEHTDAELDAIEAVIATWTQPRQFERDMATLAETNVTATNPDAEHIQAKQIQPDEGPLVPDEDVAALRKAFDELDTAEKLWLSIIGNQCAKAGYPVNMGAGPTKRRWSISTAMLHCARIGRPDTDSAAASGAAGERGQAPDHIDVHEQTVRALLGVILGEEVQPAVTLGAAFAALTIDEAERLAELAQAVGHRAHVTVDEDGEVIRVWGPAVDEIAGWVA